MYLAGVIWALTTWTLATRTEGAHKPPDNLISEDGQRPFLPLSLRVGARSLWSLPAPTGREARPKNAKRSPYTANLGKLSPDSIHWNVQTVREGPSDTG
jgi:hypothetical protein